MKTLREHFWVIVLAAATIGLAGGCASTSGGDSTLRATRVQVDWAMTRYHNRLAFGFLTENEQQQVSTAYKAYQTAFNEAVVQAHSDYNTPTPIGVLNLANQLFSILDAIP